MTDAGGQIQETHSVSAGLDYPGVGPEHAWLKDLKRVNYVAATDTEAMNAFHKLTRLEGIIPAIETAHAFAAFKYLDFKSDDIIVVNFSGIGDKDLNTYIKYFDL